MRIKQRGTTKKRREILQYAPTGTATLLQRQNILGGEVGKIGEENMKQKLPLQKLERKI